MKLPGILNSFLQKEADNVAVVYLTCVFHVDSVEACTWEVGNKGVPSILATTRRSSDNESWEFRKIAIREIIEELRDRQDKNVTKVVLGLQTAFLTQDGNIEQSVRKELGVILKDLSLIPLGFVPLHQAIIYSLRQEEGIPPNVILLDLDKNSAHLYLYKVGQLSGERVLDVSSGIVSGVEQGLAGFTDIEVLPSRILLYGGHADLLESSQSELLKFPWQNKANFLHFPKIEIFPSQSVLSSVSFAGANELHLTAPVGVADQQKNTVSAETKEEEKAGILPDAGDLHDDKVSRFSPTEESNVELVAPEELGFAAHDDVLEHPAKQSAHEERENAAGMQMEKVVPESKGKTLRVSFPKLSGFKLPKMGILGAPVSSLLRSKAGIIIPALFIGLAVFLGLLYWYVPHANLTVRIIPQAIAEEQAITIDPEATVVDPQLKVIPGKEQEKSLTAEKTIPVTGKKKVGDPARGTVTIYNKTTTLRTFKKGSILESGSLQFSLDSDVQVASASENLANSQLTYGKVSTTITAAAIGAESNMPANTEFTFKDVSSSIAVARNDQPLTGGASHDASVVTRADQDALVKLLSDELTEKAKSELSGGLGLGDTLIQESVKTTIEQKKFSQELNQEANDLQGSVTVNATGITYVTSDILTFLKDLINSRIPPGYKLLEEETKSDIGNVKIAKDGKITTEASVHALAAPELDSEKIKTESAGKTLAELQEYLKTMTGIGEVNLIFKFSPVRNRLPINPHNISVSIEVPK